ncbi:MAG: hypothetical protein WHV61_11895 [Burkholderiales bacterium]
MKLRFQAPALLLLLLPLAAWAMEVSMFPLPDGTEVAVRRFPAAGDRLLLWFPCDEGQGTAEAKAAAALVPQGIETWLPDMLGAHFLPMAPSSMDQLPPEEIAALIERARQTGKRVYLVTAGRAALPLLRGLARWRGSAGSQEVEGVLLFYPELYAGTPAPGAEARYEPVVHETVARIVILQGARSPGRWWLNHLVQAFQAAGSQVHGALLPGVRGYFFLREEQTPEEAAMAARLPELVREALDRIDAMKKENRP